MPDPLPHRSVYARLGPSRTHGIGVIAIRPIPRGTHLFANDRTALVWIDSAELAALGPADRALYEDFAIRRGGRLGCPASFDSLTPGWYLNEPPPGAVPNVGSDRDLNFFALRDIEEGEELTVRYADFNDPDPSGS